MFLAQVDQVTFHSVKGHDRRATTLALIPNDKANARSLWWEAQVSNVHNLRGNAPARIQLRFDGNRCGGAQFFAGNWYLFAVGDFDQELVVDFRDMEAIREMSGLDGSSDTRAVEEAKGLIRDALDPAGPRVLEALERLSKAVSGIPPPLLLPTSRSSNSAAGS